MKVKVRTERFSSEEDSSREFSSDSNSNSGFFNPIMVSGVADILRPRSFTNLDGVHAGVPTPTTPTLTPTTLRNIEQTFIELQRETAKRPEHINEAGFVPPPIEPAAISQGGANNNKTSFVNLVDTKSWLGGNTTISNAVAPQVTMNRPMVVTSASPMSLMQSVTPPPAPVRRNPGGRRPTKNPGLSPEEEERRRVRRERNKAAAARCRKRRLDHTNELIQEVEELEQKKIHLQKQIQTIQAEKEQLEFILEAHNANCRLQGLSSPPSPPEFKPMLFQDQEGPRVIVQSQPRCDAATASSQPSSQKRPQLGATAGDSKPSRPSSLPVASKPHEYAGVPITTPSSVIPFNFDSLMEGGTGLTPVGLTPYKEGFSPLIPSCSSQQRNNEPDTTSPDSIFPPKLVSL